MNKTTALQKRIMRRVYYAYTIAIASHSMFWQGVVLGALVALFGRLTHVASIAHNLLAVPVGNVPQFVVGAFEHAFLSGEVFTAVLVIAMVVLAISAVYRLLNSVMLLLHRTQNFA